MSTVTISPKFQVVIPKEIRERLNLNPGQKMHIFAHQGRIELVPVRPLRELRGTLKGIDTNLERDKDREF